MADFIALDVETANSDHASICQIGIVVFDNGNIVNKWQSLVNPEDDFEKVNISIHGITPDMVLDAPKFPALYNELLMRLTNQIVASHTSFDKYAINYAFQKYNLPSLNCVWIDTAIVARSVWKEYSHRGYNLENSS